jgi:hypothetical protein
MTSTSSRSERADAGFRRQSWAASPSSSCAPRTCLCSSPDAWTPRRHPRLLSDASSCGDGEHAVDRRSGALGDRRLDRHCCIERARRLPAGRETSDGRFVRPDFGRRVRFVHTISPTGSPRRVPFASNATVPLVGTCNRPDRQSALGPASERRPPDRTDASVRPAITRTTRSARYGASRNGTSATRRPW